MSVNQIEQREDDWPMKRRAAIASAIANHLLQKGLSSYVTRAEVVDFTTRIVFVLNEEAPFLSENENKFRQFAKS